MIADKLCTNRRHPPSGLLALVMMISLLVTACGSRTSAASPSDAQATAASSSVSSASQQSDGARTVRMGSEEFGLSKQELVETIERVEASIAHCMSEAGFEYIAVDYNTVWHGMTADKSLPGYSEERFASEFGFGISTLYTGKPPQLSEFETPAKIGLGEQNARIFASLSSADQVAYSRTLFGENHDATFAVSLEAENFSLTGGCPRNAVEQGFSP